VEPSYVRTDPVELMSALGAFARTSMATNEYDPDRRHHGAACHAGAISNPFEEPEIALA